MRDFSYYFVVVNGEDPRLWSICGKRMLLHLQPQIEGKKLRIDIPPPVRQVSIDLNLAARSVVAQERLGYVIGLIVDGDRLQKDFFETTKYMKFLSARSIKWNRDILSQVGFRIVLVFNDASDQECLSAFGGVADAVRSEFANVREPQINIIQNLTSFEGIMKQALYDIAAREPYWFGEAA